MRYTKIKKYQITPKDETFLRECRRLKYAEINLLLIRAGVPVRMVMQHDKTKTIAYTPQDLSDKESEILETYKDIIFGELHDVIVENGQIVGWGDEIQTRLINGQRDWRNTDSYSVTDKVFD